MVCYWCSFATLLFVSLLEICSIRRPKTNLKQTEDQRLKQFSVSCFVDDYKPDQNAFQEMCIGIMGVSNLKTMTCSGPGLFPEIEQ